MFRVFFLSLLFNCFLAHSLIAQVDTLKEVAVKDTSISAKPTYRRVPLLRDSAAISRYLARQDSIRAVKDSLKAIGDSLSMVWLKAPDPNRPNRFLDSLVAYYRLNNLDFVAWAKKFPAKVNRHDRGDSRPKGEKWLFFLSISLLLFFALLKNVFSKELNLIFQSLYNNRLLSQISKEENLFNSWPFISLYVLFGFTLGTYLYLAGQYFQLSYSYKGFQWLCVLSGIILGLFTLKIIVLNLLGLVFNLQKLIKSYISILYLSYFNAALLFLPIVVAFALTPLRYSEFYIYLGIIVTVVIFFLQFVRASAIILSEYRFPIVYLFLYICALEICPLVILFKALRF